MKYYITDIDTKLVYHEESDELGAYKYALGHSLHIVCIEYGLNKTRIAWVRKEV